jgi:hypothetical protein
MKIFKHKKGQNLTLEILMWTVLGILISFAILNMSIKITEKSTYKNTFLARDIGATIVTLSSLPSEIDVKYDFLFDYNDLSVGLKPYAVYVYNQKSNDKLSSAKFSGYNFSKPSNTIIESKRTELNLITFMILKNQNNIFLTDDVSDYGKQNNLIQLKQYFEEGHYLFLKTLDSDFKDSENIFNQIDDVKKSTLEKDAKIIIVFNFSNDDYTRISYSKEQKEYLKQVSQDIYDKLLAENNAQKKQIFNLYTNVEETTFKDTFGEKIIVISVEKKYMLNNDEQDVQKNDVLQLISKLLVDYFDKI